MTIVTSSDQRKLRELAMTSIRAYMAESASRPSIPRCPESLRELKAGVFVTLRIDNILRGCVGTIFSETQNVWEETFENARKAAFSDPRFTPVTPDEVSALEIEISLLEPPERVDGALDAHLDPTRYGIIIQASENRQALLLPGIPEVDTWKKQLLICRNKGGIGPTEPVTVWRFEVVRF